MKLKQKIIQLDDHTQISFLTLTKSLKIPKNKKTLKNDSQKHTAIQRNDITWYFTTPLKASLKLSDSK